MADEQMTDEEYGRLQAKVEAERNRRAAEEAAADAARIAPLTDLIASPAFAEVRAVIAGLPIELRADEKLASHIRALDAGMAGLLKVLPTPPVAAPVP